MQADLSEENAAKLWCWVLRRQGLGDETGARDVVALSRLTLGLHAARLSSPITTAASRLQDSHSLRPLFGITSRPDLVTVRCMRKTLHTLPVDLAATAHQATLHYRLQEVERRRRQLDISRAAMAAAAASARDVLATATWLSETALLQHLDGEGHALLAARLGVKWSWESGKLSWRNRAHCWHRQLRSFALTARSHPTFEDTGDAATAQRWLLWHYFDRYGPATVKDASWWSGLPQARIREVLTRANAYALQLPWHDDLHYMLPERWEQYLRADAPVPGAVHFLAHEDVALKAYQATRRRYLGTLPASAAFNAIGEVLPTVVADGHVVGRWHWSVARNRVAWQLLRPLPPYIPRSDVQKAAVQMSQRLRAAHMADVC